MSVRRHPQQREVGLNVGITGHRAGGITDAPALAAELDQLFATIREAATVVHGRLAELFADEPPK